MTITDTKGHIKHWRKPDRPRERLLEDGPESLSDAALLAILLRTGTKGQSAIDLARSLLSQFGNISGILQAGQLELQKIKGVKGAKIAQILAAAELARRGLRESFEASGNILKDPKTVFEYIKLTLSNKTREAFHVLYLSRGNRFLAEETLFEGTIDESAIYPREVVRRAIEKKASSLIFAHNHPVGPAKPSIEDIQITKKLIRACSTVDIAVLDHVVVGAGTFCSLRESNPALFSK